MCDKNNGIVDGCHEPVIISEAEHVNGVDEQLVQQRVLFGLHTRQNTVRQDSKQAWIALVAASLVQFIVMGIHNSFGVIYTQIIDEFKWERSISAIIGSSAVGLNFLMSPLGTQLCESFSPKIVTIFGGLVSVTGLLGSSFAAKDYAMFLSYSMVWGLGSSLCYSSTYVVVGKLFNKHMAVAMGVVTAGSGFGQLAMGPSIERMLEVFGWKTTMRSLSILALCLIVAALTYKEPVVNWLGETERPKKVKWNNLFDCSLWCVPGFSILTAGLAIFNFGYYIPIIHVPNYAEVMGSSAQKASYLISFMAIPSVVSRLVFGKLADHRNVNKLLVFQICLGIMALSTLLLPLMSSKYIGFAVYMILFGIGEGCMIGTAPTIVADIVGRERISPALGLLFFSFAAPLTAGPYFAGWLFAETNRYEEAFFVAGGTMMVCIVLLLTIHFLPKRMSGQSEGIVSNEPDRIATGDSLLRRQEVTMQETNGEPNESKQCLIQVTGL